MEVEMINLYHGDCLSILVGSTADANDLPKILLWGCHFLGKKKGYIEMMKSLGQYFNKNIKL